MRFCPWRRVAQSPVPAPEEPRGVSPRRLQVWDMAGVSLVCPTCDECQSPLELASGLLDVLAQGKEEPQVGCAMAARIGSAVCLASSMSLESELLPVVVYNKLQQVLAEPVGMEPLQHLREATLLHAKFLLELFFSCNRRVTPLTRQALRLMRCLRSDSSQVWGLMQELKASRRRQWHQKNLEGQRFQVACLVLEIYGLSALKGDIRAEALEEITSTAQALTMTESHTVGSFERAQEDSQDVGWLVGWMILQAAGLFFCPKPCNGSQALLQSWAIEQARDLAHVCSAVGLRAVALLISWREKLEEEEPLAAVLRALSAASAGQGDHAGRVMQLLETPSLVLGLWRVPCVLHMDYDVICVPGITDLAHSPMNAKEGLSPEQLPLEFWEEYEEPARVHLHLARPEAIFTEFPGHTLDGEDILMQTMSLAAAKVRSTTLPNCVGFCGSKTSSDWHFKGSWSPRAAGAEAVCYQKERASPLFTRQEGYRLDGKELMSAEMSIEEAKRLCGNLQDCMGFHLKADDQVSCTVYFKSGNQLIPDALSCCYLFQTTRHALPADGTAFLELLEGDPS